MSHKNKHDKWRFKTKTMQTVMCTLYIIKVVRVFDNGTTKNQRKVNTVSILVSSFSHLSTNTRNSWLWQMFVTLPFLQCDYVCYEMDQMISFVKLDLFSIGFSTNTFVLDYVIDKGGIYKSIATRLSFCVECFLP